jgi:hypothetical protein
VVTIRCDVMCLIDEDPFQIPPPIAGIYRTTYFSDLGLLLLGSRRVDFMGRNVEPVCDPTYSSSISVPS